MTEKAWMKAELLKATESLIDMASESELRVLGEPVSYTHLDVYKRQVLVYDVSRWGRFQDPDVSASYEVRCRQAGVTIEYCAEQFRNDGSLSSAIVKQVKRSMAAEYSRELSVKVFAGQSRLIGLGFRQGGPAGYGLRRQLVDQHGNLKTVLGSTPLTRTLSSKLTPS